MTSISLTEIRSVLQEYGVYWFGSNPKRINHFYLRIKSNGEERLFKDDRELSPKAFIKYHRLHGLVIK